MRFLLNLIELDAVPPAVARQLVDTLFDQPAMIAAAAAAFGVLCAVGFVESHAIWYLAGIAFSGLNCAWRMLQIHTYRQDRDRLRPVAWAWRSLPGAYLAAFGWGLLSLMIPFEADRSLAMMAVSVLVAAIGVGALRCCALRLSAIGQLVLGLAPLAAAAALSPYQPLRPFAGLVVLYFVALVAMTLRLNRMTITQFLHSVQNADLLDRLNQANQQLASVTRQLETLAATDPLTEVTNRRAFDAALAREWRRCARERVPLSLLLIDIDHFALYNGFYGQLSGDTCLRTVAALIGSALRRPGDLLARFGGDEFVALLPRTDEAGAEQRAYNILQTFAAVRSPHDTSPLGHLTVSIGAACMLPDHRTGADVLIARADAALYAAKRSGRAGMQVAATLDAAALPAPTTSAATSDPGHG